MLAFDCSPAQNARNQTGHPTCMPKQPNLSGDQPLHNWDFFVKSFHEPNHFVEQILIRRFRWSGYFNQFRNDAESGQNKNVLAEVGSEVFNLVICHPVKFASLCEPESRHYTCLSCWRQTVAWLLGTLSQSENLASLFRQEDQKPIFFSPSGCPQHDSSNR